MKTELTYKDIPKSFVNWFKETFDDRDKIDVFSEYDRGLSVAENQQVFLEKFSNLFSEAYKQKELTKQVKEQTDKEKVVREQEIEKEEHDLITEWKNQTIEDIEIKEFDIAEHLILLTAKNFSYATIIVGEGGIGKTYCCVNTIKKHTKDFIYKSGYTTPLSLYKFLYDNKDKLIILDDIEGIFKDGVALAILKGCLWDTDGKRLVFYDSTSSKLNAPNCFEFKGRLIILCNRIPNPDDLHIKAVMSRTIHYQLDFTYNQKIAIIQQILKHKKEVTKKQKEKIMKIIKKNTNVATDELNIRTMEKLISYIKYDEKLAEKLFQETTYKDVVKNIVWTLMNSNNPVNSQVIEFIRLTGRSRWKFFDIKRELKSQLKKVEFVEMR